MLVGTGTHPNYLVWLWLLWLPVVTHRSVNMNYFNCYLCVQISLSAVVSCWGTEKLGCHEMVDEKWWIICRLSNLCWSQMSPGEPPSLLTGCICTHNMSGNAAALFSVYSCIDSLLLHLLPSQSQNINSPLHLSSIYMKRKSTTDPRCVNDSTEKREIRQSGWIKTRTIGEKLQVQKSCCWQQRHICIILLKRVEVWTLWERKSALREDKVKQIQRGAALNRRARRLRRKRSEEEWTHITGLGGCWGGTRTQQELNVDRLSWIIHSALMNDRWAEHYYPSKNYGWEGRKAVQVTLPLKRPRPSADPNITEVSPSASASTSVNWLPPEIRKSGYFCQKSCISLRRIHIPHNSHWQKASACVAKRFVSCTVLSRWNRVVFIHSNLQQGRFSSCVFSSLLCIADKLYIMSKSLLIIWIGAE